MIAQRSSKTALVTGGSSGISLCVVKTLILEGFKVTVLDLNEAGLCTIDEAGPDNLLFIPCDITDWKAVKAAFNQSHQYFGSIQVVVNGAGVYEPKWSSFWENAETQGYKTLDINLSASIYITRLAITEFLQNKTEDAVVVNISSIAGQRASFYCPLYTASKWGISGFTRALGNLDERFGIRVAAIAPGVVMTPMWTNNSERESMVTENDEWVMPEEVAEAIMDVIHGKYGYKGGDVIEVLKKRRLVPLAKLPSGPGATASNSSQLIESIMQKLKEESSS